MRKNILILGHNDATQFIDIFNQYTRLFDPEKYCVTVAYLTGKENQTSRERTIAEDVIFLEIPKKDVRGFKVSAIKQLLKMTREKNYEIVICHRYKPIYIMMWVAQFHNIPAMFLVMHELRTMKAFGRRLLAAALWRKNMYFAGVSNAVRDDLRQSLWRIPQNHIVTLYNVIDTDLTEPELLSRDKARAALHLNNDDFIFGSIGRLARNKDQATLIQAFNIIKPYCPNAKLVIMGEGELEPQLRQQIQECNLLNDVILTGFIPSAVKYIKAFDSFVLPSIQEAFGRVLIEAMLAKCPIIASRVNGIPEVMGDTGELINAKDSVGFARAMQRIYNLTPEERQQLAEIAYRHVYDNYSIPAFSRSFWELPPLLV
ncbi:MAG TPA: glycosyltransferase [Gammaproteobacteria bacterium]|jgi:glycosyltransferase involved in cell wall biosynthesis|nr:glycosyltransferase [Gammaproteobacteria bacterium]